MATKANIIIDQGTTFSTSINLTDDNGDAIDLTGYTGRAQMRKHYTSSNAQSFTVSLQSSNGIVTLSLTETQTANLTAGRYVYDVEVVSGANVVSRIVEGFVTVTPEVTR
jgi:DUF4097 and DUF4098 domain-containing protein YvlB